MKFSIICECNVTNKSIAVCKCNGTNKSIAICKYISFVIYFNTESKFKYRAFDNGMRTQ